MSHSGSRFDITITKGSDYFTDLVVYDPAGNVTNLVDYTGYGVIRNLYGSSGILGTFEVLFPIPESGLIWYQMRAVNTAQLPVTQARHELEIVDPANNVQKYIHGLCNICPELNL